MTLHEEIKQQGVYSDTLHIGEMIDQPGGLKLATSNGRNPPAPTIQWSPPDDIAQEIWALVTDRDQAAAIVPTAAKPERLKAQDHELIWAGHTRPARPNPANFDFSRFK